MKAKWLSMFLVVAMLLIAFVPGAGAAPLQQPYSAGAAQTYVVLYKSQSVSSDAATVIANAGGTLVYSYDAIGVVIARSDNSFFRGNLLNDNRVESAAATTNFATQLSDDLNATDNTATPAVNTPAPGSDTLSGLQWDMDQIHAPDARAITGGSPNCFGRRYRHGPRLHPPRPRRECR